MKEVFTKGASSDSRYIREAVFIEEQGFKQEFDEYDDYVDTLTLYSNYDVALATGRLYECSPHEYKLGRIAVLSAYRSIGLGSKVIECLEKRARDMGGKVAHISAQLQAQPFYEKCGYTAYGDEYMEEHVPHIAMKKNL